MRQYERKLKWAIILFLGMFALMINLATFYIITTSMNNNFIEMSQTHMDHQYENCRQRMSVIEQQFISLTDSAQLKSAIESDNSDSAEKKLSNIYQSIQGIQSLAVYALKDGHMEYLAGNGQFQYLDRDFDEIAEHVILDETEPDWYILPGEKSMGFLCPIYIEERQEGCLFVKFSIDSFMSELENTESYDFWEEHLAVSAGKLVWTDDAAYWAQMDTASWEEQYAYRTNRQTLLSSRAMTQTGANLIQTVTLKMEKQYRTIALGLTAQLVISLFGIYIGANKLVGNIIAALVNLKQKMEQIH